MTFDLVEPRPRMIARALSGTTLPVLTLLFAILVCLMVIGLALYLWWTGQASPGDVEYVLTA